MNFQLSNASTKQVAIGAAALLVVSAGVWKIFFSSPSYSDSVKVVCEMRLEDDSQLLDDSKQNTREDLADSIRDRAKRLNGAADKTSGEIQEAFKNYSRAMNNLADALEEDSTGESFAEIVANLSKDKLLTSAQETLQSILNNQC